MASQLLYPDAILSQTNLTGTVSAFTDSPSSPDATWLTNNAGGATAVRVSFPTPSNTLLLPAVLGQVFKVLVRITSTGTNAVTADIALYESGSLVSTLATGLSVTSTTGQIITATLSNPSVLADLNGTNVELAVTQSAGTGGSPASRKYMDIGAIEWTAELVDTRYTLIT